MHTLKNKPEDTVEMTAVFGFLTKRRKIDVMLFNIPLPDSAPPKHIAHKISHIVFIIPDMPRVAIRLFISVLPVSMFVEP